MSDCNVKSLEINGVKYVPQSEQKHFSGNVKIVILQRGWIMVGYYSRDGENCKLERAATIRNWGTKKGLGELASEGPKKDTVLDACNGIVEFHRLTEIAVIACDESKWLGKL